MPPMADPAEALLRLQQALDAAERSGDTDEIERLSALLAKLAAEQRPPQT